MTDENRKYEKKKRAEWEEQTRLRITESAVALHGTLGPSRTSISAISKHAGVRRSTVYRHFPDELALFTACTSHWMADNPLPDPESWAAIGDVDARLGTALNELYAYYRRTERMMSNILRDEEIMPLVQEMMGGYRGYLGRARNALMRGRQLEQPIRRLVEAAIGHALAFYVWRSLAIEQGLADAACAKLMCDLIKAVQPNGDR